MRSAVLLLLGVAAALLVTFLPSIDLAFGPSHRGQNDAQWALAGEGGQRYGLVGSRLGARSPSGEVYANHPPLTGLSEALTQAFLGPSERAVRLPGLLTALATIPLLWLLLRSLGSDPLAATIATVVTLASPMFLGFGPMVDTPMMSLPFGLGALLLWRRPPRSPWPLAVVATLAVLAGWQAALLIGALAVAEIAALLVKRTPPRWELIGGFTAGVALLSGWLLWVHGSISPILDQFTYRSGNGDRAVGLGASVHRQIQYLSVGFPTPVLLLGLAGCVLAVWRRQHLRLVVTALLTWIGYSLLLRQAAFFHPYWNYWALLPVAIGLYLGAELVLELLRRAQVRPEIVKLGVVGVLALMVVASAVAPTYAEWDESRGVPAGELVRDIADVDGNRLWLVGNYDESVPWVEYYLGSVTVEQLTSPAELEKVAAAHPDDTVLVSSSCTGKRICKTLNLGNDELSPNFDVTTSADLLRRLRRTAP